MLGNDKCSLKIFFSIRDFVLSVAPSKKVAQKAILGDQVRIQVNTFYTLPSLLRRILERSVRI